MEVEDMIDIIKDIIEELEIIKRERMEYQELLEKMSKRWSTAESILSLEVILNSKNIKDDNLAKYLYVEEEVIVDEVKFIKDKIKKHKINIENLNECVEQLEKELRIIENVKHAYQGKVEFIELFNGEILNIEEEIYNKNHMINFINWTKDCIIMFV